MRVEVYDKRFEINTTPLETISVSSNEVTIELDDVKENRHRIKFSPYQAIKVITIDCVSSREYFNDYSFRNGYYQRYILNVDDSEWINALKSKLSDNMANFLNESIHYVLPLQENIIEIIAHKINIEKI